jgi:hypothetical protein
MKNYSRNLLVVFNNEFISEREAECLHSILIATESPEPFCIAHELVDRNRITSRKDKLMKESRRFKLRPFRFLINKN